MNNLRFLQGKIENFAVKLITGNVNVSPIYNSLVKKLKEAFRHKELTINRILFHPKLYEAMEKASWRASVGTDDWYVVLFTFLMKLKPSKTARGRRMLYKKVASRYLRKKRAGAWGSR